MTKVPRFAFEKFPEADPTLTTQMKCVGETMAIGRTFKESLQKALRGLEVGQLRPRLRPATTCWGTPNQPSTEEIVAKLATPERRADLVHPLRLQGRHDGRGDPPADARSTRGSSTTSARSSTMEDELRGVPEPGSGRRRPAAGRPSSTASPTGSSRTSGTRASWRSAATARRCGIVAVFKSVDTCAAEFEAYTPYYYSTYEATVTTPTSAHAPPEDEIRPPRGKKRIMILGGGPNRIGQGIEFDYCCCQAAFALREPGIETIMVNSNPETVSAPTTTPATSVLRAADGRGRAQHLRPRCSRTGVIVQFGGQTPLNLAQALADGRRADHRHQRRHRSTSPRTASSFSELVDELGLQAAGQRHRRATCTRRCACARRRSAIPVLVRPSFVLGGRAMEIVYDEAQLERVRGRGARGRRRASRC